MWRESKRNLVERRGIDEGHGIRNESANTVAIWGGYEEGKKGEWLYQVIKIGE